MTEQESQPIEPTEQDPTTELEAVETGTEPAAQSQAAQSAIPPQWRMEKVTTGSVTFDCPTCQEHYQFDSSIFAKDPEAQIEGLTKTNQSVGRNFGANILPLIAALFVYYYAHQWINGPDAPLNQGILIPVFIAVIAYSIAKPLFSAGLFSGKRIPIYRYQCTQCQSEIFIAASPKMQASPMNPPGSGSGSETK